MSLCETIFASEGTSFFFGKKKLVNLVERYNLNKKIKIRGLSISSGEGQTRT